MWIRTPKRSVSAYMDCSRGCFSSTSISGTKDVSLGLFVDPDSRSTEDMSALRRIWSIRVAEEGTAFVIALRMLGSCRDLEKTKRQVIQGGFLRPNKRKIRGCNGILVLSLIFGEQFISTSHYRWVAESVQVTA